MKDARSLAAVERLFTPEKFETEFLVYRGAAFGFQPALKPGSHWRPQSKRMQYGRKILLPLSVTCAADLADPKFIDSRENLGVATQITDILRNAGKICGPGTACISGALMTEYGADREKLSELCYIRDDELVRRSIPQAFIDLWEKISRFSRSVFIFSSKRGFQGLIRRAAFC